MRNVACIVEGHADVPAIRNVLWRIAEAVGVFEISILQPHRVPRNQLIAQGPQKGRELERVLALQARRVGENGVVVVLVDADDDDPECVRDIISDVGREHDCWVLPVAATREFEAWFLAALPSLRTHSAVSDDAEYTGEPEQPRDAKGLLESFMTTSYKETLHQPAFAALMDLSQASDARSFGSMRGAFEAWLHEDEHSSLLHGDRGTKTDQ